MELVAARGPRSEVRELAFLTGVLSLMDVLLEMPIDRVVRELNLPPAVASALVGREGHIGMLLSLAENIERDDRDAVASALANVESLRKTDLATLQLSAFQWANQVSATGV